jgi:hypothetical protein
VLADAGAVVRPTANATPPMATAIATPRTILRRRPLEPLDFAAGMTGPGTVVTGFAATGLVGVVAGHPAGAAGVIGVGPGSGVVGWFGS